MDFDAQTGPFRFECESDTSDSEDGSIAEMKGGNTAAGDVRGPADIEMRDDPSLRGLDDDREGGEGTVDIAESPALGGKSDEDIGDRPTDVPPPGDDGVVQRFFVELPSDSEDDSAGGGHTKQGVATADDGTEKSSHIDLTSPSNDTSVCDSPPTGPSFAISQPIVSNRYLREHIESLRWMKEELRKRNNLLVRLRELMKRDLEEIERAIRLRDEEEILDE